METITPWYIAVEPFDPSFGEKWTKYIEWSGLAQLTELVTLDFCLCPPAIKRIEAEDWEHNVQEDLVTDFFRDLEYLLKRVSQISPVNILAAIRNPPHECRGAFSDSQFEFKGYDLVEVDLYISALTNCGGFPKAFRNGELNDAGLLPSIEQATEVSRLLQAHYPNEPHARCHVWALWKMKNKL